MIVMLLRKFRKQNQQKVKTKLGVSTWPPVENKPEGGLVSTQTDLIPHGSKQISNGVSFICPEPPQVCREDEGNIDYRPLKGVSCQTCAFVPVCRGTEMCILQFVRTTTRPAVSSLTTMGLSAGSFSIRSLTSFKRMRARTAKAQADRTSEKALV